MNQKRKVYFRAIIAIVYMYLGLILFMLAFLNKDSIIIKNYPAEDSLKGYIESSNFAKDITKETKAGIKDIMGLRDTKVGEEYAKYTVKYYLINLSGIGYELGEEEEFTGKVGEVVTPEPKEFPGFIAPEKTSKEILADGTTEFKYYYDRNTYKVKLTTNGKKLTFQVNDMQFHEGVVEYTYGEKPVFANEIKGYIFKGIRITFNGATYFEEKDEITFEVLAGDMEVEVVVEIIDYPITYNLDGGIEEENPRTYNWETDDFTLKEPTKKGYIFLGWTGSGLDEMTKDVTVIGETREPLEFTAHWEKTEEEEEIVIVESDVYDVDQDELIITKVPQRTTIEEYKSNIRVNGDYKIIDKDGNEVNTEYIFTDYRVKTKDREYVIAVIGDINPDGIVNILDLVRLRAHLVEDEGRVLTGIYKEAADVNLTGAVDIVDLSRMRWILVQ